MNIRPLDDGFGAMVTAEDLPQLLCADAASRLRRALSRHGLLIVRGLEFDDEQHASFAQHFGPLQSFGKPGQHALLFRATNVDEQDRLIGTDAPAARLLRLNWLWHCDGCYWQLPIGAVALRAVELPSVDGGQTQFADMVAAYGALSAATRAQLEGLMVDFSFEHLVRHQDVPSLREEEMQALPSARHPLVRTLPDGRRSLFLSPPYMKGIVGLPDSDGAELIAELTAHATQHRFVYEHAWRQDDLVLWDNRWTLHRVLPYPMERARRHMRGAVITDFSSDADGS